MLQIRAHITLVRQQQQRMSVCLCHHDLRGRTSANFCLAGDMVAHVNYLRVSSRRPLRATVSQLLVRHDASTTVGAMFNTSVIGAAPGTRQQHRDQGNRPQEGEDFFHHASLCTT
jgi:hypothetical protein